MLPDFLKVKNKLKKDSLEYVDKKINNPKSVVSEIGKRKQHEGNEFFVKSFDGHQKKSKFKRLSSKISVTQEDIIKFGHYAFNAEYDRMAREFRTQQEKYIFKALEKITEETGNSTDGKGRPFSPDVYFETLEKIMIDFDDDGTPPKLSFAGTDLETKERLEKKLELWRKDETFMQRYEQVMEKKRSEWLDRENHRKLVD